LIRRRIPNAIVLVTDPAVDDIPEDVVGLVTASDRCVAIGTKPAADGETVVRLSTESGAPPHAPAFTGVIDTPSRRLEVMTVELETCWRARRETRGRT
jgi:hypothetical protein